MASGDHPRSTLACKSCNRLPNPDFDNLTVIASTKLIFNANIPLLLTQQNENISSCNKFMNNAG
jgi:hypothetical protein